MRRKRYKSTLRWIIFIIFMNMTTIQALLILLFASAALGSYSTTQQRLDPARVLILYDGTYSGDEDLNGVQDSLQVAQFYANARGVPLANLLEINITANPTFSDVTTSVLQPVVNKLDSIGPKSIDVMAVMWPLPFRASDASVARQDISIDTVLMLPYKYLSGEQKPGSVTNNQFMNNKNPYFHANPTFSPDYPRFDRSNADLDGFYLVSRIDGPDGLYGKFNMIANSIYADKYIDRDTFWGNTYINTRNGKTLEQLRSYPNVYLGNCYSATDIDGCLGSVMTLLQNLSLPYRWENNDPSIGEAGAFWMDDGAPAITAPQALFYSGWYQHNYYMDVYDWLPGAFANDLNSDSFSQVRDARVAIQSGPKMLNAGVACVTGSVGEPFGYGHPRGSTTLYYLLRGYSYAEAASLGIVYISWNSLAVGDPLYQPLAAKEPAVDTEIPQIDVFEIQRNEHEGHWVYIALSGVETAKLTFKYGILSIEENSFTTKGYKKYFKEYIGELQSSTEYVYQASLVDPKGNTITLDVGTFTTPARSRYNNETNAIPGPLECFHFDYGGDGIGSYSYRGKPYFHWSRPDSAIDTRIYDFGTYYMKHDDWMKYTVDIASSGIYSVTWDIALPNYDEFNVTFSLDGQLVGEPSSIPMKANDDVVTVPLNDIRLAAGEHILKVHLIHTKFNATKEVILFTNIWKQMSFKLSSSIEDVAAPIITKLNSEETNDNFVEKIAFSDDLHVWYVEVWINGALQATWRELSQDGVMTFYIPKAKLQLGANTVVFKAFDSTDKSVEQSFSYNLAEIAVPDGTIITPAGVKTPSGEFVQPQSKTSVSHPLIVGLALMLASLLLTL